VLQFLQTRFRSKRDPVEDAVYRINDSRRIAAGYDKLANSLVSAVALAVWI
jgi:hypothetical protein